MLARIRVFSSGRSAASSPSRKRAAVFFDGRNVRYAACKAFDARCFADFHPLALARRLTQARGWDLSGVHYYIGVPKAGRVVGGETQQDWASRISRWQAQGVRTYTTPLAGNNREKGIDLRMALDMVRLFEQGAFDVAVVCSADQDFQEAAQELRLLARRSGRSIHVATAFPAKDQGSGRGIDNADEAIRLSRADFAASLDYHERPVVPLDGAKPRRPLWTQAAAAVTSLYLCAAAATFAHATLSQTGRIAAAPLPLSKVLDDSARSLLWPVYWMTGTAAHAERAGAAPL